MSYCRKEGKDIIIFATEEDLSGPSKVTLLPDDPSETDYSHQGAILPNGEINWDCPCLGNLPNGPCGPSFREAFTCWVETRDDQEAFAEKCFENFTKWEECLSDNRDIYKSEKPEKEDREENKDFSSRPSIDNMLTDTPEAETTHSSDLNPGKDITSKVDSRPAIAAAFVEGNAE